jgi:hypothetical protein|tara:strand:+ start:482 stop:703 length:222 start_codon:yes stop_codon:yes gene_type:complete
MQTSVILFFSGIGVVLSLIVGVIAGWHINDVVYQLVSKDEQQGHPEMYDQDGVWINEELLSVRFVDEEEDDYH